MLGAWMYLFSTRALGHQKPLDHTEAFPELKAAGGNLPLWALMYMSMAPEIWRMLLAHCTCLADFRALDRVGRRMEMSRPMIPMTTSNSTRVKPGNLAL